MKQIEEINEKLVWVSCSPLILGRGDVRIKVTAASINRADLVQREGKYPPPPGASPILGLECSGLVIELGQDVEGLQVGDEVCALLSGGGYAQEVVCPAGHVLPKPKGISLIEAAALPEVFTTAWLNLRREGQLQEGERVLVHAGASGVGTAAIQLCRAWGNPVVVTVGSDEKCQRALSLGAELAINRKEGAWDLKTRESGGFDVILDPVGGSYLQPNIGSLNPGGRLVNIGLLGGAEGTLKMGPLLSKRLQIKGSVLRSRSDSEKAEILKAMRDEVWPMLETQAVSPIVHSVLDIEQAEEGHSLLRSDQTIGKIVLRMPKE